MLVMIMGSAMTTLFYSNKIPPIQYNNCAKRNLLIMCEGVGWVMKTFLKVLIKVQFKWPD